MIGNLITKTLDFRVKWPTVAQLSSMFNFLFYGTNGQIQSFVLLVTYCVFCALSSISPQYIKDTSDITFLQQNIPKVHWETYMDVSCSHSNFLSWKELVE